MTWTNCRSEFRPTSHLCQTRSTISRIRSWSSRTSSTQQTKKSRTSRTKTIDSGPPSSIKTARIRDFKARSTRRRSVERLKPVSYAACLALNKSAQSPQSEKLSKVAPKSTCSSDKQSRLRSR